VDEEIQLEETGSLVDQEPESDIPPESPPASNAELEQLYRIGDWHGLPNYGCPHCSFSTVEGAADVHLHVLSRRQTALHEGRFTDPHIKQEA
jgi:hypothetical protein